MDHQVMLKRGNDDEVGAETLVEFHADGDATATPCLPFPLQVDNMSEPNVHTGHRQFDGRFAVYGELSGWLLDRNNIEALLGLPPDTMISAGPPKQRMFVREFKDRDRCAEIMSTLAGWGVREVARLEPLANAIDGELVCERVTSDGKALIVAKNPWGSYELAYHYWYELKRVHHGYLTQVSAVVSNPGEFCAADNPLAVPPDVSAKYERSFWPFGRKLQWKRFKHKQRNRWVIASRSRDRATVCRILDQCPDDVCGVRLADGRLSLFVQGVLREASTIERLGHVLVRTFEQMPVESENPYR